MINYISKSSGIWSTEGIWDIQLKKLLCPTQWLTCKIQCTGSIAPDCTGFGGFDLRFCCLLSCVCPDSWVWSLLFFLFSSSVLVGSGVNIGRAVGCWAASWAQCTTTKDILSFLSTKISFYAHQCCKFRKKLIKCGLI